MADRRSSKLCNPLAYPMAVVFTYLYPLGEFAGVLIGSLDCAADCAAVFCGVGGVSPIPEASEVLCV